LFPEWQLGSLGLIPWVAPSLIGTIAIVWLTRHYRRKFHSIRNAEAGSTPIALRAGR
jgi:hypothetical protein